MEVGDEALGEKVTGRGGRGSCGWCTHQVTQIKSIENVLWQLLEVSVGEERDKL